MTEKKQAIILVSLVLAILTGIFLYHTKCLESRITSLMIEGKTTELHLVVESLQKYSYATYENRIKNLLHSDPAIIQSFAKQDKTRLYALTKGKYESLKKENPYFQLMQFHLPDGSNFLDMQQQEVSDSPSTIVQPIVAAVHQKQAALSGFEMCQHGLFFRVVHPVFSNDVYIGALEIGIRGQQILTAIEENLGETVSSYFLQDSWQKTGLSQYRTIRNIGKFAIDLEKTPLIGLLPPHFFSQHDDEQIIKNGDQSLRVHNQQIFTNFKNEQLGGIIFFQDISEAIQRKQSFFWGATLAALSLVIIMGTTLYFSFGRILASLINEIATRKQAELDILERERRILLLLNSTAEGIFGLDNEGNCTFINQSCLKLLGYDHEEELLGHNLHELIHHHRPDGSNFPKTECPMCDSFQHGHEVNIDDEVLWRKNGQAIPVEYHAYPVKHENILLGSVVSFSDISKRKQDEEDKERLATAIEHAADEIIITNTKGIIEYVNPAFEQVTGYSRQEAIGKKPKILSSGKHSAAFFKDLWDTLGSGKIWSNRITNKTKNGLLIEEDATISPIFAKSGITIGYVAVKRDITERIKMEERLQQASKMETLGNLAGTIAHDFNNILNGISGFTSLALLDVPAQGKAAQHLAGVMQASATATDLVQQILAFSRKSDTVFAPLTIQDIINDTVNLLRCSTPKSIKFEVQLDMNCRPIYGNSSQLHQVLMNLGTNGSHAMQQEGGVLTIQLSEEGEGDLDKYAKLQIKDTGTGIAPDVLEQMFEPYFTTKKEGLGTGLGLSTVHKIVKNHQGNIAVQSELGIGTVFTLHFPLTTKEVEVKDTVTLSMPLPEAAGHILFVDDAGINVILGQEILQNAGYSVTGLSDSNEALELFHQQPEQFDLVVTDQQMPKLTGMQMARKMIQIRPDIPILMVSGDQYADDDKQLRQCGIRENIPKPLGITSLLAAVEREIITNKEEGQNKKVGTQGIIA